MNAIGRARSRMQVHIVLTTGLVAALGLPAVQPPMAAAEPTVAFTILHTNDFHGNLEFPGGTSSTPGAARVAATINDVRTSVGTDNVLLFDAGDIMQGTLLSNIQQGMPTIDYYRTIGYDAATLGNHEFDWGQTVLGERIAQAEAPATTDESPMQMVAANITTKDAGGACTWTPFDPAVAPFEVFTVGTTDTVDVAVIGVGSVETPYITIAEATEGLCFRDPVETIAHHYADMSAAADMIVVLSHNGYNDGGYGYGIEVYGDQTLAARLNAAGTPVDLIVGGHSHTNLSTATVVGDTTIVQAYYAGRRVGRADVTVDLGTGDVSIAWAPLTVAPTGDEDPTIAALVAEYASDPDYLDLISTEVGYTAVDLIRNYNGDSMMGAFVQDAIYGYLNSDAEAGNDVDMVFNNPGGIRTDLCVGDCDAAGLETPTLLTYGQLFSVLPFGNQTVVGSMTGAQIQELMNQSATLFKGALQVAGIRHDFYRYADGSPGPQPYAWGAYDIEVLDGATWVPLDPDATYRVATNEFLAPAGQDGFAPFKYMTDISYWGDMLDQVIAWTSANHGSIATAYAGPDGDGTLDGRITRDGNGDDVYESGEVIPVTVLHHNDSHGRLLPSGSYPGLTNLATLITQERAHNPDRTLLLSSGDNIQGDSMMYYFKSAGLGYAADGTDLVSLGLDENPLIRAFDAIGYDAMTLGNHEFNFGSEVFSTLADADFPMLQANIADDGDYGLAAVPVEPYTTVTVGPENIEVAILGIGNHRVPSYELPSNIAGLTFTNPISTGQSLAPGLAGSHDAVIALTHIGFTENPSSIEVDTNVDTYFAAQVPGVDAVIGGHSHTSPQYGFGPYKWLPTFVGGPDGTPVIVSQAYRYNSFLGEMALGLLPDGDGGYEVVARAGRYLPVTTSIPEDLTIKAIVQPYADLLAAYNETVIGSTTTPIDALEAFTEETNAANLQADASVWKLESAGVEVDVHLSGAMTNRAIADGATPASPYELKVSDMFTLMPYENSLVVMEMTGPQLKTVLERAYRNYWYYEYVPDYGGYSHYTTCMLDTDAGNRIVYRDTPGTLPDGDNVLGLLIGGMPVDFTDATTTYRVSTVNYLAAGACNFSDAGTTLWPLDQIVADTQYYVRDAVIEYVQDQTGPISPAVEGRISFPPIVDTPVVTPEPSLVGEPVVATATFADPAPDSSPYSCTVDHGDGSGALAGTVDGTTCTGPAHAYALGGEYAVTVTVTDADGAWWYASTVHTVTVFDFGGFLPPVDDDGVTERKAGSTLPVKFSLGGDQGMDIFADGYPQVTACAGDDAIDPIVLTDPHLNYNPYRDQYTLLFKTEKAWKHTCRTLTLGFVDGTMQSLDVEFVR